MVSYRGVPDQSRSLFSSTSHLIVSGTFLFVFYPSTFLQRFLLSSGFLLTQPVWLTHCFSTFRHQSQLCRVSINAARQNATLQSSKRMHRVQSNEYSTLLPPILKQGHLLVHSPISTLRSSGK